MVSGPSDVRAVPVGGMMAAMPQPKEVLMGQTSLAGNVGPYAIGMPMQGRPVILAPPPQPSKPVQVQTLQQVHAHQPTAGLPAFSTQSKTRKLSDRVLHPKIKALVPESQAYMDLLEYENKLDTTTRRKQFDIFEALKRPLKTKSVLRMFITSTYTPPSRSDMSSNNNNNADIAPAVGSWELRIEGRLLEELNRPQTRSTTTTTSDGSSQHQSTSSESHHHHVRKRQRSPSSDSSNNYAVPVQHQSSPAVRRIFSTYFRSLVIELDPDLYGPDLHLVEWHRLPNTAETEGFRVNRVGDRDVKCSIMFKLTHDPPQYKLDKRFARLLGLHTGTRQTIVQYLYEYIREHKLQSLDESGHSIITWDSYMTKIFARSVMKFADIPAALTELLAPPDFITFSYVIPCNAREPKKVKCFDIEVELDDDPLREKYQQFLLSSQNQDEIAQLDRKIFDTVDAINQLRSNREFLLQFSDDPQRFIHKWLISQSNDLRCVSDTMGNPEEQRKSEFYQQDWCSEAISRYIYNKTLEKKAELEQSLGMMRNSTVAAAAATVSAATQQQQPPPAVSWAPPGGGASSGSGSQPHQHASSVSASVQQQLLPSVPTIRTALPAASATVLLGTGSAGSNQHAGVAAVPVAGSGGGGSVTNGNPPAISSSAVQAANAAAMAGGGTSSSQPSAL